MNDRQFGWLLGCVFVASVIVTFGLQRFPSLYPGKEFNALGSAIFLLIFNGLILASLWGIRKIKSDTDNLGTAETFLVLLFGAGTALLALAFVPDQWKKELEIISPYKTVPAAPDEQPPRSIVVAAVKPAPKVQNLQVHIPPQHAGKVTTVTVQYEIDPETAGKAFSVPDLGTLPVTGATSTPATPGRVPNTTKIWYTTEDGKKSYAEQF